MIQNSQTIPLLVIEELNIPLTNKCRHLELSSAQVHGGLGGHTARTGDPD